jgi:hypothetical protein
MSLEALMPEEVRQLAHIRTSMARTEILNSILECMVDPPARMDFLWLEKQQRIKERPTGFHNSKNSKTANHIIILEFLEDYFFVLNSFHIFAI